MRRNLAAMILYLFVTLLWAACLPGDDDDTSGGDDDDSSVDDDSSEPPQWISALTAAPVDSTEIGGVPYSSSSQLAVGWATPPEGYETVFLDISDDSTGRSWSLLAEPGTTSLPLFRLKSATTYSVSVRACPSEACDELLDGDTASAETAEEVWQLLGSGNTVDTLTNIVSDSNAKAHAFVHGESAPAELRGRIQLYYGAMGGYGGSLSVAVSNRAADPTDETSYSDFTSHVGSSGVIEPEAGTPLVEWIGTGQGVPLSEGMGGGVRLFFEARGSDGTTRLLSLDSQDGDTGQNFNSAGDYCSLASDYEEAGGCHPQVEIGADGDAVAPATGIDNVRQQKVGVRTLDEWRWGGAVGTFMVFTTGLVDGCSASQKNHGYALYDGAAWVVQYTESSCPKLFPGVQAMAPLDLGQGSFKIQFGNPDETEGSLGGTLPFLGPKRIIYGETNRSGDLQTMEFEDWDPVEEARDLTFLWPNGTELDATAEGYIDDFVVLTPTFDIDHQIQLVVLTDGSRIPFTSVAVLRNR